MTTAFPFIGTGHVSLPGPGAEYRTTPEKLDRNQRRKEIDAYALMRQGDLTAPSWRL